MTYKVIITSTAKRDIMQAADYIEFTLKNTTAADKLLDNISNHINTLSKSPKIHSLVDDPILNSWGIRSLSIGNYLAFYSINEENNTIIMVRFLYQKSNWSSILRQGLPKL